jgi:hypothetical protein
VLWRVRSARWPAFSTSSALFAAAVAALAERDERSIERDETTAEAQETASAVTAIQSPASMPTVCPERISTRRLGCGRHRLLPPANYCRNASMTSMQAW